MTYNLFDRLYTDPEDRKDEAAKLSADSIESMRPLGPHRSSLLHAHIFTTAERKSDEKYSLVAYVADSNVMTDICYVKDSYKGITVKYRDGSSLDFRTALVCLFNDVLAFQRVAAEAGMAVHLSPAAHKKYIAGT